MMSEYKVVISDNEILSCICGTNDKNLDLIEEKLGIPVFTKGNEISIESDDPEITEQFQFIMDRIIDEVYDGGKNSEDIVISVLNTQKKINMDEVSILVPGSVKKIYPRTQHQAEYIIIHP